MILNIFLSFLFELIHLNIIMNSKLIYNCIIYYTYTSKYLFKNELQFT